MATFLLTVQVAPADVSAALGIAADLGCEGRLIASADTAADGTALMLFQTMTIDEDADAEAASEEFSRRVAASLNSRGVQHRIIGCAVNESSMTKSLFVVRSVGAPDDTSTLEIHANDRSEFEQRLAALHAVLPGEPWPSTDLIGYEVLVEGLAAGDPDVQFAPFVPKR